MAPTPEAVDTQHGPRWLPWACAILTPMVLAITGAALTGATFNAYCAHQYHGPQDTVYARVLFFLGPTALTVAAAIWTHQRPWAYLRLIALAVGMTVLGLAAFFMLAILATGINCNGT